MIQLSWLQLLVKDMPTKAKERMVEGVGERILGQIGIKTCLS